MKQYITRMGILLLALLCMLSSVLTGCTQTPPTSTDGTEQTTAPDGTDEPNASVTEEPEAMPDEKVLTDFERYASNTAAPTGHNAVRRSATPVTETFRAAFALQEYGELAYKLFFSNRVDSTWESGADSYRNMPTKPYTIESAYVGTYEHGMVTRDLNNLTPVTFAGEARRTVMAGESLWSDELVLNVPQGHYLVFEWTVTYTLIPATIRGNTYSAFWRTNEEGARFNSVGGNDPIPLPDLIGCDRGAALRVGFMGDSITMGTGADDRFWVAQVSESLGADVSVWNLGLGYARAEDAAYSASWLYKAKQCDVVGICFGVNDINSGAYQRPYPRTAAEITADVAAIAAELAEAGVRVIIFATPPYTYSTAEKVEIWRQTTRSLQSMAADRGYDFFDFATPLGTKNDPSTPAYGGHPNAEGCRVVAEAFIASGLIPTKRS